MRKASTRQAVVLVAAVLAALLTARLGFWQLDRARQKTDLQDRIAARGQLAPMAQAGLARDAAGAEAQHYRRITLRGRWLSDRSVWLDNRQMNARQGFFVVTPLRLSGTAAEGGGDVVLVQRGWSPRDFNDRSRLVATPTATGEVLLTGRIAPPPSKLLALSGAEAGPIRQNLDLVDFARETGLPLRPLSVQQTEADQIVAPPTAGFLSSAAEPAEPASPATLASPPDGLLRDWPAAAVDVGKHHGYAFQWFALCTLIVGLSVWFQLLRPSLRSPTRSPS